MQRSSLPRFCLMLAVSLAALAASAPPGHSAKRALVIGNDSYPNLGPERRLERAVADARAVAVGLRDLGFVVTSGENVGRADFNKLWSQLLGEIQSGDTVTLYFAGHGVEIEGSNYLLPNDVPKVQSGRQGLLTREALSLNEFLLDLRKHEAQVSLVILDACRDNPFEAGGGRSIGGARGLAGIQAPPEGTFIIYSAAAGETALDRLPDNDRDPNSVFTRALLPLLRQTTLPLPELARDLRASVSALTSKAGHRQHPSYYDGLIGQFCLGACAATPAPRIAPGPAAPALTPAPAPAPKTSDLAVPPPPPAPRSTQPDPPPTPPRVPPRTPGRIERGWIGIRIQNVDAEIAASLGRSQVVGALISDLTVGGPAQQAGLKIGDIVLHVGETEIADPRALAREIVQLRPGTDARLRIAREGVRRVLDIRIGDAPSGRSTASPEVPVLPNAVVSGERNAALNLDVVAAADSSGSAAGVFIVAVAPGSPAATKGLLRGDVILDAGLRPVGRPRDLRDAVDLASAQRRPALLLRVASGGTLRFVALPLQPIQTAMPQRRVVPAPEPERRAVPHVSEKRVVIPPKIKKKPVPRRPTKKPKPPVPPPTKPVPRPN